MMYNGEDEVLFYCRARLSLYSSLSFRDKCWADTIYMKRMNIETHKQTELCKDEKALIKLMD